MFCDILRYFEVVFDGWPGFDPYHDALYAQFCTLAPLVPQPWATHLTKAFDAGDGTPGYVGLAGEHPVYRVQIRLATAAAAPVSEYSSSTTAVAARRRAAKRMRAEEDKELEDRVIGISRDEDDFLTSIGQ